MVVFGAGSTRKLHPVRISKQQIDLTLPLPNISACFDAKQFIEHLASCNAGDLKKTSIAKARKLPGYRLFTRTNLEFAREWKDVESNE